MKYILLVLVIAAFCAAGKLIGGGIAASEDERRAKWQGKRKKELDEDSDIQSNMHGEE